MNIKMLRTGTVHTIKSWNFAKKSGETWCGFYVGEDRMDLPTDESPTCKICAKHYWKGAAK